MDKSEFTKKLQEIGRGLRLPVNQNGERVFDDNINKLISDAGRRVEKMILLNICYWTFSSVPAATLKIRCFDFARYP